MQAETLPSHHVSPPPPPHPLSTLLSTGIAVDKSGLIYFVDGTTIRKVDQNGIISTFLGSNDLTSARPLTCDNSMDINQVISAALSDSGQSCTYALLEHVGVLPSGPAHTGLTHHSDMQAYISVFIFTSC